MYWRLSHDDHISGGRCTGMPFVLRVCSITKQVLLSHSVAGQSKHRKTTGSFVGPLSDLTVSVVELVNACS